MVRRLRNASALILAGVLVASPACAVKDFSSSGLGSAGSSVGRSDPPHAIGKRSLNHLRSPAGGTVGAVPASTGWLLMLAGFGLLGAMGRRSEPHPLRDELGL